MDNLEVMRKFFRGDKFVDCAGIEITEISEKKSVVRAVIEPRHLNANGCVQGGMLYTLADFAFAVLANYLHPITVTQGGYINYVKAAVTDCVTATATETVRSGHNTVSEVIVRDGEGDIVCVCSFNGFVKDADREKLFGKITGENCSQR